MILLTCRRNLAILTVAAGLAALATGCHVTPYQRTLPEWIQRVYVPMAINDSFEPGLEELFTRAFVEEVTADGRLEATTRKDADVVVRIVIERYEESSEEFESDDVESHRLMTVYVKAKMYDPADEEVPIATVDKIPVALAYRSDYRAVEVEQEPDARRRLASQAAKHLLRAILTNPTMAE